MQVLQKSNIGRWLRRKRRPAVLDDPVVSSLRRQPLTKQRPFAGPWPYAEGDRDYFRGRAHETRDLLQLIQRNSLIVLYGASGLGKSSLLQAGLFPALPEDTYLPVWIRLKFNEPAAEAGEVDLVRQISAGLREAARAKGVEAEKADDRETLWEFFHELELWSPTMSLLTPLIVLDQFEEVFTLGQRSESLRKAVDALFEALGQVAEDRIPATVAERMKTGRASHGIAYPDHPPPVKILLSLREEFLPHLEDKRKQLPAVLRSHARLWLRPFRGDAAQEAIVESAGHLLAPEVAGSIVRTVAGRRASAATATARTSLPSAEHDQRELNELSVEPSLLSLFCYQMNERRIRDAKPRIDATLVKTAGDDILNDFYRECLQGLHRHVQTFIEEELLSSSGHRLSIPVVDACKQRGIDDNVIRTLEARRLVRRELRGDTAYVELTHDVLAETVVREREARNERRRVQRLRIVLALVVGAVIAGVVVLVSTVHAEGQAGLKNLDSEYNQKHQELETDFERRREEKEQEQKQFDERVGKALNEAKKRELEAKRVQDDAERRIRAAEADIERRIAEARRRANEESAKQQRETERVRKELDSKQVQLKQATDELDSRTKRIIELEKKERALRLKIGIPDRL
jgi:hypothetical protein